MWRATLPAVLQWLSAPVMLAIVSNAYADPWTFTPSLSVSEIFTDNVGLAPSGLESSDFITTVTPGISIARESRRLKLDLNYQLQGNFYKNHSEENQFINLLDATGTGELLEDRLFLDASASSSQQNITNTGGITLDNTSLTDDRASVLTYSVSPYWQERIGNFMDAELRYERNAVESSRTFDSVSNIVSFDLSSGTEFNRLLWGVHFKNEEIDNDGAGSTRFRNVTAEGVYLITQKFGLKAVAGYDDNEFANSGESIDGPLWRLGGVWRPSRRTSLEATFGERFFGTDIVVDASHRTRKTRTQLTFQRRPDVTRTVLFEQQVFSLVDNFGNPVTNPNTGDPAVLNVNVPVQSPEVFIRERLDFAFRYTHRKNTLDLSIFMEDREFQLSNRSEESKGAELSWLWDVNRKLDSRLSLSLSTNESGRNLFQRGREQDFSVIDYSLVRKINPGLDARVGYRYIDASSNISRESYTENRLFLSINKKF